MSSSWRHRLKHFLRYWPFVWGIHRWPVNSPHKGQWRGALMFSMICAWTNGWVNNRDADHFRRRCTHYDVTVGCDSISYQLNLGAVQRPWSSSSRSVWWASYRSPHGAWKPTQHIWSRETAFRICRVNHSGTLCEETWRSIYNHFSASKWHEGLKLLTLV